MSTSVSSSSLGLKSPLRPLGMARLAAAGCVLVLVAVSSVIDLAQPVERSVVFARCGMGLLFALTLAASGLRTLLAFVPQGDVPGSLRQGAAGARTLLEKKSITGTYDQPTSLMGLLIYRLVPRFAFLTPPHRQTIQGIGIRLLLLIASVVAAGFVSGAALWLTLIVATELGARWAAVIVAHPEQPATTGVRELRDHLGDKGDPVGLFHHLRHCCEKFRVGDFPNRQLAESPPHVAEQVRDARIEGEYFLETQPLPMSASGWDGIVLATAAVILAVLGSGLLLLTPLVGTITLAGVAAMASGVIGVLASATCFRLAYVCLCSLRFQSDLFLIRMRGTYNTTRVGSQFQRTSFQSDVYLDVYSARIVSELAPSSGSGWQIADVLKSSRLIVTVQDDELPASRMSELVHSAWTYQDQASSARPTDLSSPEYSQHLMRLHAESMIAAQAGTQGQLLAHSAATVALTGTGLALPSMVPALLVQTPVPTAIPARPAPSSGVVGSAQPRRTAGGPPLPAVPPASPPPRPASNPPPGRLVLPPPPPKKKP